ncbi:Protein CSN12 -like protein [Ceratocystis fimbriata CBS 114723]|uniref:Protein CSN12-like protein n=1 Tax=Ceratocystis fimbriata CBS 114723 TaxID=1035309 RepID=A0A2C5XHF3_9PEZI|nr:Protein CSN12 -like protein [Ceratocystis fimbriata CBS 114723]
MSLLLQFLSTILDYVHKQDGPSLGAWLKVEPTASEQYFKLAQELRSQFRDAAAVESTVAKCFPDEDPVEGKGAPWAGLVSFLREYVMYWRDADFDDLAKTHERLCTLTNTCGVAFANPTYGGMLLETCMSLSEALSRLTLALNKRPDLMARQKGRGGGEEERKTIAEVCAEILQKIFTTCLTDRSSARNARPEGKKVGVYMFANLTLKLLFACRRKQLAQQIFTNIETNSPPLSLYPAAQRVTFLFYLGRFWLSNNSYSRASLALDEAYRQTPRVCVSQRALILSYLVPCNILIGRLPSPALLQRPEMQEIAPLYGGLSAALKVGNIPLYQALLALHRDYLMGKGVHAALAYEGRGILWRSLARRVFLLTYVPPPPGVKKPALLDLDYLEAAARFLQRRIESMPPHTLAASANTSLPNNTHLIPGLPFSANSTPGKLLPHEGVVNGSQEITTEGIELIVSSLIDMELMHGYISHSLRKFALFRGKNMPIATAGWPTVAPAIRDRKYDEDFDMTAVPGWVRS